MIKSNLNCVSHVNTRSTRAGRRSAAKRHTIARYRLRLVKEDEEPVAEPESLSRPAEVAAFLWRRVFEGLDREAMCAVYADNSNRAIGWTVAYIGCLTRCSVEPRGLVVPALLSNAAQVVIAHNHPGGSVEPSAEDKLFTRRMAHACEVLGLRLADSLVVAEGPAGPRWTSLLSALNE
jgi:DNA repair protein RadC